MVKTLPVYPDLLLKTDHVAGLVRCDPNTALGALVRVWLYAVANGEEDRLGPVLPNADADTVDRIAMLPGLAAAMQKRGWLRFEPAGALFPGLRIGAEAEKAAKAKKAKAAAPAVPHPPDSEQWFERFWNAYRPARGKKGSKAECRAEWFKLRDMTADLATQIANAAARQSNAGFPEFHGLNPHAVRWLRRKMWLDDHAARETAPASTLPADPPPGDRADRLAEIARQKANRRAENG